MGGVSVLPFFEDNKNRAGGFEYPFYIAAVESNQDGYVCSHHWHYHMELLYIVEGSADIFTGNRMHRAEQGNVILIPPCDVHAIIVPKGQCSRHYVIGLDPELLSPMPALFTMVKYVMPYATGFISRLDAVRLQERGITDVESRMKDMLYAYERREEAFELVVTSSIYVLLSELIRKLPELGLNGDNGLATEQRQGHRIRDALAYIDRNSHEPITASQMARLSLMSYSHFARCFKQMVHTSFSSYLLFVRIRKAEQLLLDPNRSITQIALETGFNHSSYFIRQFRESRGMTPKQFRKLARQPEHGYPPGPVAVRPVKGATAAADRSISGRSGP